MAFPSSSAQTKYKGNTKSASSSSGNSTNRNGESGLSSVSTYTYSNGETRYVDPIVAQLKAKRKLENEQKLKKAQEERMKMGLPSKKASVSASRPPTSQKPKAAAFPKSSSAKSASYQSKPRQTNNAAKSRSNFPSQTPPSQPTKKLNFNELMRQASKIDPTKLCINPVRPKSKTPPGDIKLSARSDRSKPPVMSLKESRSVRHESQKPTYTGVNSVRQASGRPQSVSRDSALTSSRSSSLKKTIKPHPIRESRMERPAAKRRPIGTLPLAKPSAILSKKLKSIKEKRKNSGYVDEYESDFIVSDDEIEEISSGKGYDRDEIWSIFNKGKKRTYHDDDYDSDEMEATGADILEEEDQSARKARFEEKREEEAERRRVEAKKARLQR